MKTKRKRKFEDGNLIHVYQRTIEGKVIFYDDVDFLVFYTIHAKVAKQRKVKLMGMCLMFDHIHQLVIAESLEELSLYVGTAASVYVKESNLDIDRSGGLFRKAFGSAPKKGGKKERTAIAYLFNNPVEKRLCERAEEYQWNFLGYITGKNPFSKPKPTSSCSHKLRQCMKEIESAANLNRYLSHKQLRRMYRKLSHEDWARLKDYIIVRFNPFDTESLISRYGDEETMLIAINSNTGSEYEIKEEYNPDSDIVYQNMTDYVKNVKGFANPRLVTMLPDEEKMKMASELANNTNAKPYQIYKYLHMPPSPR